MLQRLQKIISAAGIASRRAAEKLIEDGQVTVNGERAVLGQSADADTDEILVQGKPLRLSEDRTYIMLNKPRGYVTTLSDEKGRRTVATLVTDVGKRLYPVGRLDMDSEGLLLMTDDGELANRLMHPSHQVQKTYETTVSGGDINRALPILRAPMEIDGSRIRADKVEVHDAAEERYVLQITIHEGKNRQVRKMCEQAGLKVHRLRRISEGDLCLGNLRVGRWRALEKNEIEQLKKII